MPKATFVIGATATGKTYFIENNYSGKEVEILDVYDYQQRTYDEEEVGEFILIGREFRCLMRANMELLDDTIKKLKQGHDVVVEQTFYRAKRRISYFDEIRKIPDAAIEVYVINPGDELWKSNLQKRKLEGGFEGFKKDAEMIEFPNPAEGIDVIYEVVDGKVRMRMETPTPHILEEARKELAEEAEKIRIEDEAKRKRQELLESMKERKFLALLRSVWQKIIHHCKD